MSVIYEPKGRALEYSPLACNLWIGCIHNCGYCFGPATFRKSREDWITPRLKDRALERFESDAKKYAGDPREILFSFGTDPYGTPEQRTQMYDVLGIAAKHDLRITVLTKNPAGAEQHITMFQRNGWSLGTTICFASEALREEWEPGAPSITSRVAALQTFREAGVKTWVSVEPVINPTEAIGVLAALVDKVDLIKVGKWNHDARAKEVDWKAFLGEARMILSGRPHVFKHDLLEAGR